MVERNSAQLRDGEDDLRSRRFEGNWLATESTDLQIYGN